MARDPVLAVRIPATLKRAVDDECTATGKTRSEIARDALSAHLTAAHNAPMQTLAPTRGNPRGASQRAQKCEHRVRQGSYCARCARIV